MKRVHFKFLSSHKKPVLHLYKRLLKYTYHLPLSFSHQVYLRNEITKRFKDDKKIMAPSDSKKRIFAGQTWEKNLRNTILYELGLYDKITAKDHLSEPGTNVYKGWVERQIGFYMKTQQDNHIKKQNEKLEWNPQKVGVELEIFRVKSRVQLKRLRMLKSYTDRQLISSRKDEIDPLYIDSILLPEAFKSDEKTRREKKKQLNLRGPRKTHIQYVPTPLGRIYFLRTRRPQSRHLSRLIHNSVHTKLIDKINRLDNMAKLASLEAEWEIKHDLTVTDTPETVMADWLTPIQTAKTRYNSRQLRFKTVTTSYHSVIYNRKRLQDKVLVGRNLRHIKYWKEIERKEKRKPFLYLLHSDTRRLV